MSINYCKNYLFLCVVTLLLASLASSAAVAEQQVCVSNNTLPKHCKAGDIVVISPQHIALVCDFDKQIVKLRPSKSSKEFLCVYTGHILSIKPNTSKPPKPPVSNYPPPHRKKKKSFFW